MLLKKILPAYYKHMFTRPNSLLSKFYGAYSIQIQGHTKCFVVMESVFKDAPGAPPAPRARAQRAPAAGPCARARLLAADCELSDCS